MKNLKIFINQDFQGELFAQEGKFDFLYKDGAEQSLSVTMPTAERVYSSGVLHPIFQMNLPEGSLKEKIKEHFGKVTEVDDTGLLSILGPYLLGRVKAGHIPKDKEQSSIELNDLLSPSTETYFETMMEKFAVRSGISGVQPKILVETKDARTLKLENFIVKAWTEEYPELAANEYFCMLACKYAGLNTPEFYLSDDRKMFIMKRFDILETGEYLGFEDMCVVFGKRPDQKYSGSYEDIAKFLRSTTKSKEDIKGYFKATIMNHLLRNGDGHLKNYGILYSNDQRDQNIRMAPIYDVVTTTIYNTKDIPALSMSGGKLWWKKKTYENFAFSTCKLTKDEFAEIMTECERGIKKACCEMAHYVTLHRDFETFANSLTQQWKISIDCSPKASLEVHDIFSENLKKISQEDIKNFNSSALANYAQKL